MSGLYALLIGIDHYFEYRLPNGSHYPKLGGCVRDINKVYGFLTERLSLPDENIVRLTASLGHEKPEEPEVQWPTYRNMVQAFQQLTDRAQPGDQLYIQYSGHGGRTSTMFPAIKGEKEFDEGLVPLDIGKAGDPFARYLRDVEIYNLLRPMVEKELRLTVVFDCCHSGGATRAAGGAVRRGISATDDSPPPADSLVGPVDQLVARWLGDSGAVTRGMQSISSWRFEPKGYVLFAACRANESAFEYPFDGRENNGALTYWLVDTLNNAGPNYTWKMVADRVSAKVHGQFEAQTPMLQGEGDFRIFGHDRLQPHFSVAVLEVRPGRLRLAAGEAHGVAVQTQFAIYPVGTTDLQTATGRLATAEVTTVEATESWAEVVTRSGPVAIDVGAQAVLLNSSDVRLQREVRVLIEDPALRRWVEDAIQLEGRGFLTLATERDEYVVDVEDGAFVIKDTTGAAIPYLRPALSVQDAQAISKLVARLVHLVQYRNVQELDMPDPVMRDKLEVKLDAPPEIRPGNDIRLTIRNTQKPNPSDPNDPARVLNVTVIALSSDWSISQIYPAHGAFEPVDPGKSIDLEFEAYLPDGQTESLDIMKVFATRGTTDFRWLELPALDQPDVRSKATRSAVSDPLEQLLASVTGQQATTRAFKLTKAPEDRGWTVAEVQLRVAA